MSGTHSPNLSTLLRKTHEVKRVNYHYRVYLHVPLVPHSEYAYPIQHLSLEDWAHTYIFKSKKTVEENRLVFDEQQQRRLYDSEGGGAAAAVVSVAWQIRGSA